MKSLKINKGSVYIWGTAAVFLVITAFLTGCQKDNNPVDSNLETTIVDDAAASIAGAIGIDNGGALDQVADVLDISTPEGIISDNDLMRVRFGGKGVTSADKTYDPATGWWTVTLTRTRGESGKVPYAEIVRVYQYQFLNKNGQFQQNWKVTNTDGTIDTAYSIHHKILSGSGVTETLRSSKKLLTLTGEWMVTGVNTPVVTINTYNGGAYTRAGSDTIKTYNAVRTLNYTVSLNFANVTGPRGSKLTLADKSSGTITGTYHAVVTFQRGALYKEKTIDKVINVTLGNGRGKALFDIDGRIFNADIQTGELTN